LQSAEIVAITASSDLKTVNHSRAAVNRGLKEMAGEIRGAAKKGISESRSLHYKYGGIGEIEPWLHIGNERLLFKTSHPTTLLATHDSVISAAVLSMDVQVVRTMVQNGGDRAIFQVPSVMASQ
jgi:hypothetical protein